MPRSLSLGAVLLACVGPLLGCSAGADAPDAPVRAASSRIQGGYEDTTDLATVGLQDTFGGSICTGSLIGPNIVLTAHHCVAELINDINGGIDCEKTTFAAPPAAKYFRVSADPNIINPSSLIRATEVILMEDNHVCGFDGAILILASPLNIGDVPYAVPRVDEAVVPGEVYSAIGYGATKDDAAGTGAGLRRRRDGLVVNCVGAACPATRRVHANEFEGDKGICEGDSGGPSVDAYGRVIGVTSRGSLGCTAPIYGHVASWSQWIKDTALHAAEVGGYDAPRWATGFPTDPGYAGEPGGACSVAEECASLICLGNGTSGICTRKCDDAVAPCPEGYTCDAGGLGVCLPAQAPTPTASSGCSLAAPGDAHDPTTPVPWVVGVGLAAALLRRRRG